MGQASVLELMLTKPDKEWTIKEIASALEISIESTRRCLNRLSGAFVTRRWVVDGCASKMLWKVLKPE